MSSVNQIWFDEIYRVLVPIRSELREAFDAGKISQIDETVYFRLDVDQKHVLRCDDQNDGSQGVCVVSWDSNNANLRSLAREVMHQLLEETA